jgi:signal transduction histidine kinase/DNA-binding response OmpR family regulator/HAMP domain-containing protein
MPEFPVGATNDLDGRVLLSVLAQVRAGDFTARMPLEWTGVAGKVADQLNDMIIANQALESELARVSRVVGRQGELSQRAVLGGFTSSWTGSLESVNSLIDALVRPTSEMQRVIGAVADGDLSKKVSAQVSGEMLELKNTINAMVDQLNGFVSEVSRVAREVGTEGKLGQAAAFTTEVGGVWKDLTDNVNLMAGNLTGQVRNIAEVTTAVANGDLSKKISIDVKGEFLELKDTVNAMVDQLKMFAGEVTRVAREVGVEGRLGGQAQSKEVAGVWKDLTDNVNQLAANLTNQVRAIAEVATAVTEGDLTRQVTVEASGEVAVLKNKLNEMIRNLRETTRQNVEQDWLKTNRERFTRILQGQADLTVVSAMILSELAALVSAQHGVLYTTTQAPNGKEPVLEMQAGYGYEERKRLSATFRFGEGLVGQCAKEKKRILLTDVPSDYVRINSGLGAAAPLNIIVLPVLFEGSLLAVVELASFSRFSLTHQAFLDSITETIGITLNTIRAAGLTGALLKQSQSQAEELLSQREELRGSNADLERQARQLAEQNVLAEEKTLEVEKSNRVVEEKISQLAVSSKYKSEFIANMSHELRTPLNSLLILAQQLEENREKTMTETQVEYASVIRSSGQDLLVLLNSILDLAKVESGTVAAHNADVSIEELRASLMREFEPVGRGKGIEYSISIATDTPAVIVTDQQRLRQILKNLLANAFKFTERGSVRVDVRPAQDGWSDGAASLNDAPSVLALAVTDTGIGIDAEQQLRIFEAFAQADGTTSRIYGGTGLGLSISRELVHLLGGEITVTSARGEGTTFTVYLPASASTAISAENPATPTPVGTVDQSAGDGSAELDLDGVTVLVVDDDASNIFALSALIEAGNGSATSAANGAEALASLGGNPDIDVVLMDIMMLAMDGYDTIRAIRAIPRFQAVPIVAISAKLDPDERQRCLDAGADDYLPKPVDRVQLLPILKRLATSHTADKLATGAPAGQAPPVPVPVHGESRSDTRKGASSMRGVRILVVDDDFRNIFAMTALLERSGALVTVAEGGAESIGILERSPEIDIVLMDIMMPVMDGYEAIRAIRALGRDRALAILAVTGKATSGERERCIEAGADGYIPKPVVTTDLVDALGPWLPANEFAA